MLDVGDSQRRGQFCLPHAYRLAQSPMFLAEHRGVLFHHIPEKPAHAVGDGPNDRSQQFVACQPEDFVVMAIFVLARRSASWLSMSDSACAMTVSS